MQDMLCKLQACAYMGQVYGVTNAQLTARTTRIYWGLQAVPSFPFNYSRSKSQINNEQLLITEGTTSCRRVLPTEVLDLQGTTAPAQSVQLFRCWDTIYNMLSKEQQLTLLL